jgi:phage N-6-adenine-methyltransferase
MNRTELERAARAGLAKSAGREALARTEDVPETMAVVAKLDGLAKFFRARRTDWDKALDCEEVALEGHVQSAGKLDELRQRKLLGRGRGRKNQNRRLGGFQLPDLLQLPREEAQHLAARQAKALAIWTDDKQRWAEYVRKQRETLGAITLSGLVDAKAHVSQNTGQPEWYTPAPYIEAARRVLGAIDLDPASSALAQETVKATTYYTVKDDGLSKAWKGRVWLNPPYTSGLVDKFTAKLCGHVTDGSVTAAVLLVNNATDAAWFRGAVDFAEAMCCPTGRIKFIDETGEASGAPLQGQVLLYFGSAPDRFISGFKPFGFRASLVHD